MLIVLSSNVVSMIICVVYKYVSPWSGSGTSIMLLVPMFPQPMTSYSVFHTLFSVWVQEGVCESACVKFVSVRKTVSGWRYYCLLTLNLKSGSKISCFYWFTKLQWKTFHQHNKFKPCFSNVVWFLKLNEDILVHFLTAFTKYLQAFYINKFHAFGLFLHLLKRSENQRFSDIFRGYRKRQLTWNGLVKIL